VSSPGIIFLYQFAGTVSTAQKNGVSSDFFNKLLLEKIELTPFLFFVQFQPRGCDSNGTFVL